MLIMVGDPLNTFFFNLRNLMTPIHERADVIAMKRTMQQISQLHFDENATLLHSSELRYHFVITWGLREPFLLNHYVKYLAEEKKRPALLSTSQVISNVLEKMDNNWHHEIKNSGKYEFIPRRLRHKHTPGMIKTWNIGDLAQNLPHEAHEQLIERTKKVKKGTFGSYNSQHLLRQWYIQIDKVHPSKNFIVMGEGASDKKYNVFREAGLHDISAIRARYQLEERSFDAGILAYACCMYGTNKGS